MIKKFKLKHLIQLEKSGIPDYTNIVAEIDGYKNKGWNKKKRFQKSLEKIFVAFEMFKQTDPTKIKIGKNIGIKYPKDINNIPFIAMIQLVSSIKEDNSKTIYEKISEVISITCFNEHTQRDFDYDTISYKNFKNVVENNSAINMLGLFNFIIEKLENSNKSWSEEFLKVAVVDSDYEQAGGEMLNKFNVITTIKKICNDFNLPYEKAMQLPYSVVQSSSLADATSYFIQDNLTKIKERKMRSQRIK